MNVDQLIKKLRKLDKDLPVFTAAHDNSSHEVQGPVNDVDILSKDDDFIQSENGVDEMPNKWVTLR